MQVHASMQVPSSSRRPCSALSATRRAMLGISLAIPMLSGAKQSRSSPLTEEIYAEYSYQSPQDVLKYVRDVAPEGDPEAVLAAIDDFSEAFPMYKTGPIKGRILEEVLIQAAPSTLAVELGSFVGYGAVRMARSLPPGANLVCVEANPECVNAMKGVLRHAGLLDRVIIEEGLSNHIIPGLKKRYGAAQLLFEDHCKSCYLPDLLLAEQNDLLQPGAWVLADNVIVPGAPDFLSYCSDSQHYCSRLLPAPYEYEMRWKKDWSPQQDALCAAIRLDGLNADQRTLAEARLRDVLCSRFACTNLA